VRDGVRLPIALFVTDVPVNPNIARRIRRPSVSASIAPFPSASSEQNAADVAGGG